MPVCASCTDDSSCATCIPSRTTPPNCLGVEDGYYDNGNNNDLPFPGTNFIKYLALLL